MQQADNSVIQKKDRVVFIEFLRIIACFFVIVNHTNSIIFLEISPTPVWFVSLFYFFACKVAVPIFVMISGYIMLDRQDTYKKMISQFFRMLCCLIMFSGFYYISFYLSGRVDNFNLKDFFARITKDSITKSYWYLYLYLGVILMMPFLQKMVLNLKKIDFHVFFLISGVVFSVWPIITHYIPELTYTFYFDIPLFSSYICMLLLGCYIKRYCPPAKKWRNICIAGFIFMCASSVGLTYIEYLRYDGAYYLFFEDRRLFPIIIASFCLFYAGSTIQFHEKSKKWIVLLGKLTFGIYLVSDLFIEKLFFLYENMVLLGIYPMAAMIIFEVVVFITGAFAAYLFSKIPLIKKII